MLNHIFLITNPDYQIRKYAANMISSFLRSSSLINPLDYDECELDEVSKKSPHIVIYLNTDISLNRLGYLNWGFKNNFNIRFVKIDFSEEEINKVKNAPNLISGNVDSNNENLEMIQYQEIMPGESDLLQANDEEVIVIKNIKQLEEYCQGLLRNSVEN